MATDSSNPLPVLAFQQFIQHVHKAFLIASAIATISQSSADHGLSTFFDKKGYRRAANTAGLCTCVVLGESHVLRLRNGRAQGAFTYGLS